MKPRGVHLGVESLARGARAYVSDEPLSFADPLGLVKECVTKLMLVTAYDDKGPGRDWAYYKSHRGGVGPNTVAVANTNPQDWTGKRKSPESVLLDAKIGPAKQCPIPTNLPSKLTWLINT